MLTTLSNISKVSAEKILVELTEVFLPSPFNDVEYTAKALPHPKLLKEIQGKLGLSENDFSDTAKTVILERLSNELSSLLLSVDAKREAIKRLEKKANINIQPYRIEFGDDYRNFEKQGITKDELQDLIKAHDQQQHLFEDISNGQDDSIVFFVKEKLTEVRNERYNLLLITARKGSILTFQSAWKIFESDARRMENDSPLDLFKKFIEVYGLFFKINKSFKSKFKLEESVNFNFTNVKELIRVTDRHQDLFSAIHVVGKPFNMALVRLVYVVDITKYNKTLQQHGFRINS